MDTQNNICQSCGMPLDSPDILGTNKDGSANQDYCRFCFKNGEFTNPYLTMAGMKTTVRIEMEKQKAAPDIIEKSVNIVPNLKRWKVPAIS